VPASEPALGDASFRLLRCRRCGSAVTDGELPPGLYDSGAYRPGRPRGSGVLAPVLRAFGRRRLALLGSVAAPGARVLDVGAGRGRFVAAARAAGYDASGIEPSARGVAAAAAIGAPVVGAGIGDASFPDGSFDAITLWHVLEHLDDPAAALERIASWLGPGGALLIGVPNLASWQARLGGARWYHLDVPRHRVHFTPAGLTALLGAHGFEVVAVRHVLLEHNPFGMWQSLLNRVTRTPSYLYNLLKRNAPLRSRDLVVTVAGVALAPVAAVLEWVAGLTRHGGTVVVLARREGSYY
jgi:SAM-dependent methyltransferase